jgi:hypothetical protein
MKLHPILFLCLLYTSSIRVCRTLWEEQNGVVSASDFVKFLLPSRRKKTDLVPSSYTAI